MEKTTISSGLDGLATMLIQRLQTEARIPQAGTTDRSQVVKITWANAGCEGWAVGFQAAGPGEFGPWYSNLGGVQSPGCGRSLLHRKRSLELAPG
jgi:hypothetical protein